MKHLRRGMALLLALLMLLTLTACEQYQGPVSTDGLSDQPGSTSAGSTAPASSAVSQAPQPTDPSASTTAPGDTQASQSQDTVPAAPQQPDLPAPVPTASVQTEPVQTSAAPTAPVPNQTTQTGPVQTQPTQTTPVATQAPTTAPAQAPTTAPTAAPTVAPTNPPATQPTVPYGAAERQGLKQLSAQPNGANLKNAYLSIVQAVDAHIPQVDLTQYKLTEQELTLVYGCYRNDYPQHFWLDNRYAWSQDSGGRALLLELNFTLSGQALDQAIARFEAAADSILSQLHQGMSAYERELVIHDALIRRCRYAEGTNAHSAYGALVDGVAVCEGYAKAFQYLLNRTNIVCMTVSGVAGGQNHAWNAVQIGGSWYYTDVTWDDPVMSGDESAKPVFYAYFNLTRAMMDADHLVTGSNPIALPAATATDHNYHVYNGTQVHSYDHQDMVARAKAGNVLRLYVTGDMNAFLSAYQADILQLLADAGYHGATQYTCGRELVIIFS